MGQQGFFPDPPSRRFAYDEDGTNVISFDNNATTSAVSLAQLQTINDESTSLTQTFGSQVYHQGSSPGSSSWSLHFYFPELRDITEMFLSFYGWHFGPGDITTTWSWSSNSTQPLDGTWTNFTYSQNSAGTVVPDYRTQITPINLLGVKAIRVNVNLPGGLTWGTDFFLAALHFYGVKSANQTPHRLIFCDALGNEFQRDLDYGDQPRASTRIWSPSSYFNESGALYLKNISPSKTANNFVLGFEGLTSDMITYSQLSLDNINYSNSLTGISLGPGSYYGPVYVKYAPTTATALALKSERLKLSVASWA